MNLHFDIRGIPEVKELLDSIVPKHARAILRNTNYAIAAEVRKDIKAGAPVHQGKLKSSVAVRNLKSNPDNPTTVVYFRDGGFHWRFVEHGTKSGTKGNRTVTGGRSRLQYRTHPGVRARPFVKPAVDTMREKLPQVAREKFVLVLQKTIARELKKRAKF